MKTANQSQVHQLPALSLRSNKDQTALGRTQSSCLPPAPRKGARPESVQMISVSLVTPFLPLIPKRLLESWGVVSLRAQRSNLCPCLSASERLLRRLWLLAMTPPIRFSNRSQFPS